MIFGDNHVHYFFKPAVHRNSVAKLLRLDWAALRPKIPVPRLCGYVQADGRSDIIGLLLTNVESQDTLEGILLGESEAAQREKWFRDMKHMPKLLREKDIIWGDAKADNILVDKLSEVWMIDIGGSYTVGWLTKTIWILSKEICRVCRRLKSTFRYNRWTVERRPLASYHDVHIQQNR